MEVSDAVLRVVLLTDSGATPAQPTTFSPFEGLENNSTPSMLAIASLGQAFVAARCRKTCQPRPLAKIQLLRPAHLERALKSSGRPPRIMCFQKGGAGEPPAKDLDFSHVASEVKSRLASAMTDKKDKMDTLQAWLSEAKLKHSGESDSEHNQTEMVAEQEGDAMGLGNFKVDVNSWLSNPNEEMDAKMAGVLVARLLQAFHEDTGEALDDEDDDCFWRLQGFIPGGLVDALDHELLKRLIRSYTLLPFSGV